MGVEEVSVGQGVRFMPNSQINGTMLQGFTWNLPADGQHWRRLGQMAPRLVSEGITSVWMPPAYKGQGGINDVGYGVYDLWDLGEFDQKGSVPTKYGTRREYQSCVVALHEAGLDVLGDIVLNHKLGADESEEIVATPVAGDNRVYEMGEAETIEAWTRFTFPGRAGELDDFEWDWTCFKGVDYDAATDRHGVWRFKGKHWDEDVSHEYGNFDYLMGVDIDLHDKKVYKQLVKWGIWYVETTGVDGVRLDAVKHMSRDFYRRWLHDVRKAVGRELFCVGEYWGFSPDDLSGYLGDKQDMSLFDVPLHFAFYRASVDREHIDFAHMLDGSFVSRNAVHTVTFVDNHDTQPYQSLASTVEPWFKPVAYSIILLREAGYPCVFFADLFGLPNDSIPAVAELPLLMEVRRRFAYGRQHDYLDEWDLAGWTRSGLDERPETGLAVVLSNREPEVIEIEIEPEPAPEPEPEPEAEQEHIEGEATEGEAAETDEHEHDDAEGNPEEAERAEEEPVKPLTRTEVIIPTKDMYVGRRHAGETWRCVLGGAVDVKINDEGVGTFPASTSSMVAVYLSSAAAQSLDHIPIVVPR